MNKINIKNIFLIIILTIIPILIVLASFYVHLIKGPYWSTYSDPQYVYLFHSLAIATGDTKDIGLEPHPGVPLMELGGLVIRSVNLIKNDNSVIYSVLSDPEHYIRRINISAMSLEAATIFTLGIVIFLFTGDLLLSLMVQFSPFFSFSYVMFADSLQAEVLLALATSIFILICVCTVKYKLEEHMDLYLVAFSLCMGFGIATKFSFIPMLMIPALLIPKVFNKLKFLAGSLIFFLIFTFPVRHHYGAIFHDLGLMTTHSGYLGKGASFFDITGFLVNLKAMISKINGREEYSFLLFIPVIFILIHTLFSSLRKVAYKNNSFKFVIFILIAQCVQIFMVIRHSYKWGYLQQDFILFGLQLFFIYLFISTHYSRVIIRSLRFFLILIIVAVTCLNIQNIDNFKDFSLKRQKMTSDIYFYSMQPEYDNFAKIDSYWRGSIEAGLNFGRYNVLGKLRAKTDDFLYYKYPHAIFYEPVVHYYFLKAYPKAVFYDLEGRYFNFKQELNIKDIREAYKNKLLFRFCFSSPYVENGAKLIKAKEGVYIEGPTASISSINDTFADFSRIY